MNDIKIEIPTPDINRPPPHIHTTPSHSSEDVSRQEMKWTDNQEAFIRKLQADCKNKSIQYDAASHTTKKRYNQFSIPTIIIPIIMSVVSPHLTDEYKVINAISLAFVGVLNGIQSFYNYGKKSSLFNEYSGRYNELFNSIDIELSKPKRHRVQLDVYLERISQKKGDLDATSPFL